MKRGRKREILTEKEARLMNILWANEPMYVREILAQCPDPKPHFNTVSTTVRNLEAKGYVAHEVVAGNHRFYPVVGRDKFRERTLAEVIRDYFGNSYKKAVSMLAQEEKITPDELREIIDLIESKAKESEGEESRGHTPSSDLLSRDEADTNNCK